jgi:hypothetical protein
VHITCTSPGEKIRINTNSDFKSIIAEVGGEMLCKVILMMFFCSMIGCCMVSASSGEQPETYPEIGQSIIVTGEISKVKMTNFPGNPWEELIIAPKEGEKYVIIGELAQQLWNLNGEKLVTISGILEPKMMVQGKYIKVIEIQSIDKIENINETNSSN